MSGVITAAVVTTAAGAYMGNKAKQDAKGEAHKQMLAAQAAEGRAQERSNQMMANAKAESPGPVYTSGGGSYSYDPTSGASRFYQPGSQDVYGDTRLQMMMDKLMGGSGANQKLQSDMQNKALQVKQMQDQANQMKAEADQGAWNFLVGNSEGYGPQSDAIEMIVSGSGENRFRTYDEYLAMAKTQGFPPKDEETYNKRRDELQKAHDERVKTIMGPKAYASYQALQSNIERESADLAKMAGVEKEFEAMKQGVDDSSLMQLMSKGRKAQGGGKTPTGPTSQNQGALNYDVAFDDPRKAQMQGYADDFLARAAEGADPNKPVDWEAATGMNEGQWNAAITGGGGDFERIQADGADLGGLGAFRQWLNNQATNRYQAADLQNRERMARAGLGYGSQSAIGQLAAQQALGQEQTANEAQAFGLKQGLLNDAWNRKAQAAGINNAAAAQQAGLRMQGAGMGLQRAALGNDLQNAAWGRNRDLWNMGTGAFDTVTGLDQRDIDNNFRNEQLGMGQDMQAWQQQMGLADWIRSGQQTSFNQDLANRQLGLSEIGLGSNIGQNYQANITGSQMSNAAMQNANDQAALQRQAQQQAMDAQMTAQRNQMYMSAFGTLMGGVSQGVENYKANKTPGQVSTPYFSSINQSANAPNQSNINNSYDQWMQYGNRYGG